MIKKTFSTVSIILYILLESSIYSTGISYLIENTKINNSVQVNVHQYTNYHLNSILNINTTSYMSITFENNIMINASSSTDRFNQRYGVFHEIYIFYNFNKYIYAKLGKQDLYYGGQNFIENAYTNNYHNFNGLRITTILKNISYLEHINKIDIFFMTAHNQTYPSLYISGIFASFSFKKTLDSLNIYSILSRNIKIYDHKNELTITTGIRIKDNFSFIKYNYEIICQFDNTSKHCAWHNSMMLTFSTPFLKLLNMSIEICHINKKFQTCFLNMNNWSYFKRSLINKQMLSGLALHLHIMSNSNLATNISCRIFSYIDQYLIKFLSLQYNVTISCQISSNINCNLHIQLNNYFYLNNDLNLEIKIIKNMS